jgi:hypothetical protein
MSTKYIENGRERMNIQDYAFLWSNRYHEVTSEQVDFSLLLATQLS